MMENNRITVLMGAGSMIEATGVSTKYLTNKVNNNCKKYTINNVSNQSLIDEIYNGLIKFFQYDSESISFEDIYHVLEIMPSFIKDKYGHKGHTSPMKIIAEANQVYKDLKMENVYGCARELIDTINKEIHQYDTTLNENRNAWFKNFFQGFETSKVFIDVFNLNYDTWVEQSLVNYNDGFVPISDYPEMMRFDINKVWENQNINSVNHLHGQICFEYPSFKNNDINRFTMQEPMNTIYKYTSFDAAQDIRRRTVRSGDHTQSGENLFKTNIVTGLMKTDKLLWNPLNIYHMRLANCLMQSNKLIIIGYGFSDLYVNSLLDQFNNKHYKDRKVIIIDYVDDKYWQPRVEHPLKPSEKAVFSNRLFRNDFWRDKAPWKKVDQLFSDDKQCLIYFSGFKKACDLHADEIHTYISS